MATKFPFNTAVDKFSRQLYTKQMYTFLSEFFRLVRFDSTVEMQDGVPLYDYCYDGRIFSLPVSVGGGKWSGWLWYLGTPSQILDTSTTAPGGIYLKVKLSDGSTSYCDSIASPSDVDQYNYYVVGQASETGTGYVLCSGRTCGDIRIDMVPWLPEAEA